MKKIICLLLSFLLILSFCGNSTAEDIPQEQESELLTVDTAADIGVYAPCYALMDVNTGTLLAACSEHKQVYPASVTKIMSLILFCEAIENGKYTLDETVICSDSASAKGGSQIWLEPGEEMTVDELMRAVVVASANDACTLLAEKTAGSESAFVELMNRKAKELGMKDTNFDNCAGLDDDTEKHLSSAYDVAVMSCELLKHDMIREYTCIWMDELRNGKTQLVNTNKLIRYYSGATGLKTGTTSKAGCCVSASARRDGLELVAVIMGAGNSKDRFNGAKALLDYGFASYEIFRPAVDKSQLSAVKMIHGVKREVIPECGKLQEILINKGCLSEIKQTVVLPESLEAPVKKGEKIGTAQFLYGDKVLIEYPLTASDSVAKMTVGSALKHIVSLFAAKNRNGRSVN